MKKAIFILFTYPFLLIHSQLSDAQMDKIREKMLTPTFFSIQEYDSLNSCAGNEIGRYIGQVLIPLETNYRDVYGFSGLKVIPEVFPVQTPQKANVYKRMGDTFNSDFNQIKDMRFYVLSAFKFANNYPPITYLKLLDQNGDTLYYEYPNSCREFDESFLILGYYEKVKKTLIGKDFIFNKDYKHPEDKYYGIRDIESRDLLKEAVRGSSWKCIDVGLSKTNDGELIALLEGDNAVRGVVLARDILYAYNGESSKFIDKKEFLADINEKKKEKELIIKKYGKNVSALIEKGIVKIGWTEQMCIYSWGKPDDINTTITKNGKHEQWVYNDGSYLYFENGRLSAIQK